MRGLTRLVKGSPAACAGLVLVVLLVLTGTVGPLLVAHDPVRVAPDKQLRPPEPGHPFGTDNYGRDIFTRVVYGARISLQVGIATVALGAVTGLLVGLPAGYYGGWWDMLAMRCMDILLAFPGLLLALSIIAVFGTSLLNVVIAVGVSSIPIYARLVRGSVLAARHYVYIEAARVTGCGSVRIMLRHLLPNIVAPVIVVGTLGIANAILAAAALSFLGMGVRPPTPEWGAMLSEGRNFLRTSWWMSVFPGLAILITALGVNLVGDALRDATDPQLGQR